MKKIIIIGIGLGLLLIGCGKEPTPPAKNQVTTPAPTQNPVSSTGVYIGSNPPITTTQAAQTVEPITASKPVLPAVSSGASGDQLIAQIDGWKTTYPALFTKYPELEKLLKSNSAQEIVSLLLNDLLMPGALEIMISSYENEVSFGTDILDAIKGTNNKKEAEQIMIGLLSHPEPRIRWTTVGMLAYLLDYRIIPEITRLLTDPDVLVRSAAVYAVGCSQDEKVIPALVKSMSDPDQFADVRNAALYSLERWENKLSLKSELIKLLSDPDSDLRRGAVEAIGHARIREAMPALLIRLADPDAEVRLNAIWALGELNTQEEMKDKGKYITTYTSSLSQETLVGITRLLSDPASRVRCQAMRTLAIWKIPEVKPQIIGLLSDADPQVRAEAIAAVIKFDATTAAPDLIRLLSDPVSSIRYSVINALGKWRTREALPEIIKCLSDPDVEICRASLAFFYLLEAKEAIPDITKLLNHNSEQIQKSAQIVLKKLGVSAEEIERAKSK